LYLPTAVVIKITIIKQNNKTFNALKYHSAKGWHSHKQTISLRIQRKFVHNGII